MRNIFVVGLLVALACATAAHAVDFTRIRTLAAFRTLLVDRTLTDASGQRMVFTEDGEIIGPHDPATVAGEWFWSDEAVCRRVQPGDGYLAGCRTLHIRGDAVIMQDTVPPLQERSWTRS